MTLPRSFRLMSRKLFVLTSTLSLGVSLFTGIVFAPIAAAATCGTGSLPTLAFISDPSFQINTSNNYDANYMGYQVTTVAAIPNLWIGISNIAGGTITLAPTQSQYESAGAVGAATTAVLYFLAKSTGATVTPTTFTVTVYNGNPNLGAPTTICTYADQFNRVDDTITAGANKVTSITVSSASANVGQTLDVTAVGNTGTIGSGPVWDPGVINITPSVFSTFDATAWQLTGLTMTTNPGASQVVHNTFLHYLNMGAESGPYTVVYHFRAVGSTASTNTVLPLQDIASGTQVKVTSSVPASLPSLPAISNVLTLAKTSDKVSLPNTGGDVVYTVTASNSGSNALTLDSVQDTIPDLSTYKTGSAKINGVGVGDPSSQVSGGHTIITFVGPYSIPATGNKTFTYTLTMPATPGLYTNSAIGYSGNAQIDTTATTADNSPATVSVRVRPVPPVVTAYTSTIAFNTPTTFTPTVVGTSLNNALTCIVDPADSVCKTTVTIASEGTYVVNTSTGAVTFTPTATFAGTATAVTYRATDAYAQSGSNTITITVNKGNQATLTMNATSGTYGANVPLSTTGGSGTGAITYVVNSGPCTVSGANLIPTGAGTCNVTATKAADSSYNTTSSVAINININKAVLTVTASSAGVNYGGAVPTITPAYSGFVNSESAGVLTAAPTCSTVYTVLTAVASSPVGTSCSGATAANYSFSYVAGAVTIAKAPLTITASSTSVGYGSSVPTITPAYSGFVNGQDSSALSALPICSTTYTNITSVSASPVGTSCSGATAANYAISYVGGTVTITKVNQTALVITPTSGVYGANVPLSTTGGSGTGAVTYIVNSGSCTVSGATITPTGAGTCNVTATKALDVNYNVVSSAAVDIVVAKAVLTVTSSSSALHYGDAVPSITPAYSGFVNSENVAALSTAPTCSTVYTVLTAVASSPVGTSCSGGIASNYSFNYVAGSVTIAKAPLVITASSTSVGYGSSVPTITASYSGFVNGENSSALSTLPTCSTTYTNATPVASSPVGTSCGSATANNYSISYVAGTVTITKATQSTLSINPTSGTYGATISLSTTGGSGTGSVSYVVNSGNCTVSGSTITPTGVGNCNVTATHAGDANYNSASSSPIDIVIAKASLIIIASSTSVGYGSSVPTISPSYSGFVNGENSSALSTLPTCSTTYTNVTPVASSPVGTSCSGAIATNYSFSYVAGTVAITKATQSTLSINPASGTYGSTIPLSTTGGSGTGSVSYVVNSGNCTVSGPTITPTGVGNCNVTATKAGDSNYSSVSSAPIDVAMAKAPLTITASSTSVGYGSSVPTISPSYSGFVNGENSSALSTLPTCSTTYTNVTPVASSPVGTSCSGAIVANYSFSYIGGTVTITKASQNALTTNPASGTYGSTIPLSTTGGSGTGAVSYVVNSGNCTVSGSTITPTGVGNCNVTATKAGDLNYSSVSSAPIDIAMAKASLVITASSATVDYGDATPTITATYLGFVNGENSSALSTLPTCSTGYTNATPVASSPVGTSCSGAIATNYSVSYVAGTVTINKASQSALSINPASGTYGSTIPLSTTGGSGTGSVSYVVNSGNCTISGSTITPTGVGNCNVTATHAGDSNYSSVSSAPIDVAMAKAPLTIAASSVALNYGASVPSITPSYSGFVNGENSSALSTLPTCSTIYTNVTPIASSPVGTSCSGAIATNYTISYVGGTVTINKASQNALTTNPASGTYGSSISISTTGGSGTGPVSYVVNSGNCTVSGSTITPTGVGNCNVTATKAGDSNYSSVSSSPINVAMAKAPLTITASSHSVNYGDPVPTITASYPGFVNGENSSALSTLPTCSTTYTNVTPVASSPVGTSCSGAIATNYSFSYVGGTVTINGANQAALSINSTSGTYGATVSLSTTGGSGTGAVSYVVNSGNCTVLNNVLTPTGAGTCNVTATKAADANYNPVSSPAIDIVINKAPLVITASSPSVHYGDSVPTITPSYSGFVNGEDSSALSTLPTCSTTYTNVTPVASSPVGTSCSGAIATNYSFSYVAGTVTIAKANQSALTINPDSGVYGSGVAPSTTGGSGTGSVSYVVNSGPCTVLNNVLTPTSAGTCNVTATQAGDANYNSVDSAPIDIVIAKAPITITASSTSVGYGSSVPTITASYSGFVNGENSSALSTLPTCSTTYTNATPVASSPVGTSCSGASATNYSFSYVAGTVTINKAPLTITASSGSVHYGDAAPTISPSYSGFVNGEDSSALSTLPTCSTGYTNVTPVASSPVGTSCSGTVATNYSISYFAGTVAIAKANQSALTINPASGTYGSIVSLSTTGGNGTGSVSYVVNSGNCTVSGSTITPTGVGNCNVTATQAGDANYNPVSSPSIDIVIAKASLIITASSTSVNHGDATPTISPSYSGFVNGEDSSALVSAPTCSTTYTNVTPVASSPVATNCSGAVATNYSFSYVGGTVTINKASQSALSINPTSGTYGSTVSLSTTGGSGTGSVSYVVNSGPCTVLNNVLTPTGAGTCNVTATQAGDVNYNSVDSAPIDIVIATASLTITASSPSVHYGDSVPTITPTYSGFLNGEDSSALSTLPTCSTTYTNITPAASSPVGTSCSGAIATNYTISYTGGSIGIAKTPLTITASSHSVHYGDAVPTITPSYSGFLNGEDSSALSNLPTCLTGYTDTTPISGSPVGTSCSGALADNYIISYVDGSIIVTKASQSALNINPTSGTYGATIALSATGGSGTGAVSYVVNSGNCTVSGSTITPTGVGNCNVTATQAGDANYNPVSSPAIDIVINKAPLVITASSASLHYGDSIPTITPSYSGFVNGEDASALSTLPTCSTTYINVTPVASSPVGTSCSGAVATNYSISYVGGTVTIAKANQSALNINPASGTYGATIALSTNGGNGTGAVSYVVNSGNCTVSGSTITPTGVGNCNVTATNAGDANYNPVSSSPIDIVIAKAPLVITASSHSVNYGDATPTISPSYTGFVNGENSSALSTLPTCSTAYTSLTPVGSSPVATNCSGAVATNYSISYVAGNVSIIKNAQNMLVITPASGTYGTNILLSTTGGSGGGTVTYVVNSGPCTVVGSTLISSGVGTCNVSANKAGDPNYDPTSSAPVDIVIAKASLTITASSDSVIFGSPVPVVTPIYSGFVNGDNASSLLAPPTCSTTYTDTTPVASSPVGSSCSGATADNYNISYVSGNIFITGNVPQATLTLNPTSGTYGGNVSLSTTGGSGTGTVSYVVNSGPCTVSGSTLIPTGAGTCSVTATNPGDGAYASIDSAPVDILITKASLVITASSTTVPYGSSVPTITPSYSGFVNGEDASALISAPVCSTTYTNVTPVASSPVGTSCSGATSNNYSFTYTEGSVTIVKANQSALSINPTSGTYGGTVSLATTGGNGTGTVSYVVNSGPCTVLNNVLTPTGAGTCNVTATNPGDANYNPTSSPAVGIVIAKAPLTITASSTTVSYSDAAPAITPSYAGFVNGEDASALGTLPTCSTTYTDTTPVASSPVGTSCSGAVDNNYSISYVGGIVTVIKANQATLTITPDSGVYGSGVAPATTGGTGTGLVSIAVNSGPCTVLNNILTPTGAGTCNVTATNSGDSNYNPISSAPIDIVIAKASLVITASSTTVSYSDAVPTITASYSGFVNGEDASALISAPTCSTVYTNVTPVASSPVGTSCSGATSNNYDITYVAGIVTIIKANQSALTINPTSGTYGGTVSLSTTGGSGTGTVSYVVNSGPCTVLNNVLTPTGAGTCNVTATNPGDANYNSTSSPALDIVIDKASLNITASSHSVHYGDAVPTISPSYSGFVNGEDASALISAPPCSTGYTSLTVVASSSVGTDCSGAVSDNYSFSYVSGVITISKANQSTLIVDPTSGTYGSNAPLSTSGGSGGGVVSYVINSGPCSVSNNILTPTGAGTCNVTATQAGDANYNSVSSSARNIVIDKASLNITASSHSVHYGDPVPTLTPSYAGFVNGEDASALSTLPHCVTFYTPSTPVASSRAGVTCFGTRANNYSFTYISGWITITKANQSTLVITPNSGTYGSNVSLSTTGGNGIGTVSYVVNNGPCTVLNNILTLTGAGTCNVTATKAGDANHNGIDSAPVDIVIVKALLTITASSTSVNSGDAVPTISPSYSGFVNGEDASALISAPTCSTGYTNATSAASSPVGTSCSGAVSDNYDFTYLDGSITINKANQSALTINPTSGTYGATVSLSTTGGSGAGSVSYVVNNGPCTVLNNILTPTGAGICNVTATQAGDANYNSVESAPIDIVIAKAPLSITASSNSVVYGDAAPTITASYSGFVNAESASALTSAPICSTSYTVSTGASSPVSTNCSGAVSNNYSFTYISGSIVISKAPQSPIIITPVSGIYGSKIPLSTTGGSGGGTVTYVVNSGPCAVVGNILVSTGTGACRVVATETGDSNHNPVTSAPVDIVIAKATLTITASSGSVHYGDAVPTVSPSYSGFVNSEDASALISAPTCSTGYTFSALASASPISTDCSGATSNNYAFTYKSGSIVILNPSAPVGHPISVSTPFNAPKTFSPTISGTRLDYSTACLVDPVDSVCKTTVIVKNQGSWTVDPSTGDVTFTPDSNFSGVATSLTYSVSDIFGQKGSTTLTITVSPSPKIVEKIKSVETQPGVSVSIVSTTSFTPPTGDSWNSQSTQIVNPVSGDLVSTYTNDQGTWTVNPSTNTVVFAPKDTFSGDATIGLSMTTKSGLKIVNKFKSVVYKKLVVTVYFNNNSPVLTPADIAKLKATMKIIAGGKITKTKVDGYVLISPSLAADKLLSTQRARSTSKFIASYGLKNIIAQGKGRAPESNATARRAVITITYLPANGSGSTGSNGSGSTGSNGSGPTGSNGSGPCIITYSKTPHTMATTVYFGNNSPVLTVEDIAKLKALIASLNGSKISLTQVDGYVLVSPSLAADQLLSNQRAESTSKFIKSYGFDNMVAKGMGRAPELNITARRAVITITYYPVISRVNCEAIVVNKTISTTVYFGNNSPVLTTEAIAKIESLLSEVKGHSIVSSKVNSYVLTSPSLSADMALSIARGESVARYLTSHGISNVSSFGSGRAPELNEDARKAVITIEYK